MDTAANPGTTRLRSLDAYRGFVMLAMASGGASAVSQIHATPETVLASILEVLKYQGDHVYWRGCAFWDLIQPSFMFMVGVAMPFSFAARTAKGDAWNRQLQHAILRAFVLVTLGVFLASNGAKQTNFSFVNVLAQIGLGYPFVFLLLGRGPRTQLAAALSILVADWLLFALYPLPQPAQQTIAYGLTNSGNLLNGFLAHWSIHTNPAAAFDGWFLNLFPRAGGTPFVVNEGGYTTLNFIPAIATMLFGLMAGDLLRSDRPARSKLLALLIAGGVGLVAGSAMDTTICPIVKRIWTPSWTLFSTGWTLWMLATFYGLIDIAGYRRWSFPLMVVGMNSIAIYLMAQLMKPFVRSTLRTHLGTEIFSGPYGPLTQAIGTLVVFWLVCFWMYRQKIFVKI